MRHNWRLPQKKTLSEKRTEKARSLLNLKKNEIIQIQHCITPMRTMRHASSSDVQPYLFEVDTMDCIEVIELIEQLPIRKIVRDRSNSVGRFDAH